jgi:uncharacterized protein YaeQ
MTLAPTLYDFEVELSHVERGLHEKLSIRTARHPSETLERLYLRVLAYCWLYEEGIAFGQGLSDPDAPDLYADDLTGRKVLWVRVGKPDPERLLREADRASEARVAVLFESAERQESFLGAARELGLTRLSRVAFAAVLPAFLRELAAVETRRNRLGLTIVGDHLYADRDGRVVDGPLVRASFP